MGRANQFVLNVAELLRRPGTGKDIRLESSTGELEVSDERVVDGPVAIDLHVDALTDGIVVNGTVSATWQGVCRRCLAEVGGPLVIPVQELYQTVVTDPDAFPIVQEQLDLEPMVREALLLDAPSAPLCRDDCAGICPVCGVDRNTVRCACEVSVTDDRWAALDALKPDSR